MKTGFINGAYILVMVSMLLACNCNSTQKPVSKDSAGIEIDTLLQKAATAESDSDYAKMNISLTQKEWESHKEKYRVSETSGQVNNKITGDFNGDGKPESVFIVPPAEDTLTKDAFQECVGGCNSYLLSTDTAMVILKVQNNLGGEIKNMGDLDGDGADDIMVYPSWWQSNWNAYCIYSIDLKSKNWCYLIEPITIFANELEKNIRFVKSAKQKGFISAFTSTSGEDGNIHSSYKNYKILKLGILP